jgi:L-lactate dehydrogenase complex protein LldG
VSGARAAILARVDRALRTARIPTFPREEPERAPEPYDSAAGREEQERASAPQGDAGRRRDRGGDPDRVALQERFVTEARALGVDVFVAASPEEVREHLRTLIDRFRVLSWNPERLPYGAGTLVAGAALGSSPRAEQAAAQVGVTGCHGAIAETGSLALISEPGCSRSASLLPPVHVAIVRPDDLFYGMGDFFTARADRIAGASTCTFVTGPSRTADIELSLTIGVHGPGRVAIVVGP